MSNSPESRAALLERIRTGMRRAEAQATELRKKNSRYVSVGVIAGGLATVVAGTAAALGPVVGQGPPAWKLTCGIVALLTGVATVLNGLQKQLSIAERLAKASSCLGKLTSLEFALTVNNRETVEVAREYESALAAYPDIIL